MCFGYRLNIVIAAACVTPGGCGDRVMASVSSLSWDITIVCDIAWTVVCELYVGANKYIRTSFAFTIK